MVVSICSAPDITASKRPRSTSENASPMSSSPRFEGRSPKRYREETAVDAAEALQSIVMLEDNGGIWHVDGLLELLAGALCATLGADPASLAMATDGPAESSDTVDVVTDAGPSEQHQPHHSQQQEQGTLPSSADAAGQHRHEPMALAAASWPALTEGLLRAHTASSGDQLHLSPGQSCHGAGEDDDRSSVASLSAWFGSSFISSLRRTGTGEAETHPPQGGSQRTGSASSSPNSATPTSSATSASTTFSFTPAPAPSTAATVASAAAGNGSGGGSTGGGSFSFRSSRTGAFVGTGIYRCGGGVGGWRLGR